VARCDRPTAPELTPIHGARIKGRVAQRSAQGLTQHLSKERSGALVLGTAEECVRGVHLDDLPGIHEDHPISNLMSETHFMGHAQQCEAGLSSLAPFVISERGAILALSDWCSARGHILRW
jgi:hypothetical protein